MMGHGCHITHTINVWDNHTFFSCVSLLVQQRLKEAVVQAPSDLSLLYKLLITCETLTAHLYLNSLHLILNLPASVQVKNSIAP